jgi:5-methylcytosine-specific restriction endonuclease McrA
MLKIISHIKDVVKGKASLFRPRSSKWPDLRKSFLKSHPECAACGSKEFLEVHHIKSFRLNPELELDPKNLITLCDKPGPDNHHMYIGHLGNFKQENPNVRTDTKKFRKSLKQP